MLYAGETGYLLLAAYTEGAQAQLYAIDPERSLATPLGGFGDGAWPVVSLYRYTRATELTVKLKPTHTSIYEKDTLQMEARVPVSYTHLRPEPWWPAYTPPGGTPSVLQWFSESSYFFSCYKNLGCGAGFAVHAQLKGNGYALPYITVPMLSILFFSAVYKHFRKFFEILSDL